MEQDPNFRKFIDSGDSAKVSRLVSMAYLMGTVFQGYSEDAIDIMEKYKLVHKKIKTTSNNLVQSFDVYDKAVSALINTQDAKLQLCNDWEIFQETCDKFMNADVRVSCYDAWNDDKLRREGEYLCRVEGVANATHLALRWQDGKWLQYSPIPPDEGWVGFSAKVSEVAYRVKGGGDDEE